MVVFADVHFPWCDKCIWFQEAFAEVAQSTPRPFPTLPVRTGVHEQIRSAAPRLRPRSPAAHRMHVAHRDAAHSKVVFASVDGREDRVAAIKYNTSCTVRDAGPTSRAVLPGAQTERAYLANPRSTHRALELQDATERLERSHVTLHGP